MVNKVEAPCNIKLEANKNKVDLTSRFTNAILLPKSVLSGDRVCGNNRLEVLTLRQNTLFRNLLTKVLHQIPSGTTIMKVHFYTSSFCPIAVGVKTVSKSILCRKGFLCVTYRDHSTSLSQAKAGTCRQDLKQNHEGVLLPGLFSLACSACFLVAPRTNWPRVAPPTVGWTPPPISITN